MKQSSSQQGTTILSVEFPGKNDASYMKRREYIEMETRSFYDQKQDEIPELNYTQNENQTWKTITSTMNKLHEGRMCKAYLKGKKRLQFGIEKIPQLKDLNRAIQSENGFLIQPIEGWVDAKSFFTALSKRQFFCTQYIRYWKEPSYTPEPDVIHDVLGHLPTLVYDTPYTEFIELMGKAGAQANDKQMEQLERLYWFTSEFGMIREEGKLRIYGASPAGSMGEIQNCFKEEVQKLTFDLERIIHTEFPIYGFQPTYFVINSFEELLEQTRTFLEKIAGQKTQII